MLRNITLGLSAIAFAGAAVAQSSVTVFGVIDNNIGWGKGSLSSGKQLGTGGYLGNRLGFRGSEDLGDGQRAVFVLENGFNGNNGTLAATTTLWNRQSYVGLVSRWGELLMGRQYTPSFLVHAAYDAFGLQGVAAQQVLLGSIEGAQAANIRANNAVNYRSPGTWGGFSLQLMTTDHTASPGWYHGVRGAYSDGTMSVDLALGHYNNPAIGDLNSVSVGGRYNWGPLKLYALFNKSDSGSGNDSRGVQTSAGYLLGLTELKLSVAESRQTSAVGADIGTTRRYGVGFVHSLSKRTSLYGQYARLDNSKGARAVVNGAQTDVNQPAQGFDLGIAHQF